MSYDPFYEEPGTRQDALPQPYRMVNKVLGEVIDGAWTLLKRREARPGVGAHRLLMTNLRPGRWEGPQPATPGSVSLSSDGSLVFVGTAQGEVVVVNSRGDTGTKSSFQAFDAGTAIAVLPAVTPVPAGDTNPDSIAATAAQTPVAAPTPAAAAATAAPAAAPAAVAAPASAAAATKKDPKAGKVKGVGFSTGLGSAGGGDGDGEDGAGTGRASGSKKPKPRAPPAVWSPMAAQRGWLVACGAVGPEGGALLRVLHWLPPSGEDLGVEWRHLASASLPAPLLSLSFSGDARYLCASLVDGSVHLLHMHPAVVCPPTPPTPVDVDEVTRILAQKALTGFDSDDEDGTQLKAQLMRPTPAPVAPPRTIFPSVSLPATAPSAPNLRFVLSPRASGGIACVRPAPDDLGSATGAGSAGGGRTTGGSGDAGSAAGSAAGSRKGSVARSAVTGTGAGGSSSRRRGDTSTAPFSLPLVGSGDDGTPVCTGALVWSSGTRSLRVYQLPVGALDALRGRVPVPGPGAPPPPRPLFELVLPAPVTSVAVDPLGKLVVVGTETGGVSVWSLLTGVLLRSLDRHGSAVTAAAFVASPAGSPSTYICTGCAGGVVHVYDLAGEVPKTGQVPQAALYGVIGGLVCAGAGGSRGAPPLLGAFGAEAHAPSPLVVKRRDGLRRVTHVVSFAAVPVAAVFAHEASPDSDDVPLPGEVVYFYDARDGALLGRWRLSGSDTPSSVFCAGDALVVTQEALGLGTGLAGPVVLSLPSEQVIAQAKPAVGAVLGPASHGGQQWADAVNSAFVKATCGQLDSEAALRAVVEPSGPEMLTTLGRAASASVIGGSASVLGGSASVARGSVIGAGRASQAGLPRQGSVAAGRRAAEAVSEVPPEPRQFGPPSALNPANASLAFLGRREVERDARLERIARRLPEVQSLFA